MAPSKANDTTGYLKPETCPNCGHQRGPADWHTLWSGGFTCPKAKPGTTGDVVPDVNGQRLTTEHGHYSERAKSARIEGGTQ